MPDHAPASDNRNALAWAGVLDELEHRLGLAAAEANAQANAGAAVPADDSARPLEEWAPPAGLGPIPAELVERAQQLLAGQRELSAELESARNDAARHLAAIRSVPAMRAPSASVYLDVTS